MTRVALQAATAGIMRKTVVAAAGASTDMPDADMSDDSAHRSQSSGDCVLLLHVSPRPKSSGKSSSKSALHSIMACLLQAGGLVASGANALPKSCGASVDAKWPVHTAR